MPSTLDTRWILESLEILLFFLDYHQDSRLHAQGVLNKQTSLIRWRIVPRRNWTAFSLLDITVQCLDSVGDRLKEISCQECRLSMRSLLTTQHS